MVFKKITVVAMMLVGLAIFFVEARADLIEKDLRWYGGIGPGISRLKPGGNGSTRADDSYELGGKIFGGYHFTERLALEAYYTYLGKADIDSPRGEVKYRSYGINGTFYFYKPTPFPEGWSAFGRLGVGRMINSANVTFERDHDYHLMFGGGLEYGFDNGFSLRGDLDFYDKDANLFGFYLLKRFGGGDEQKRRFEPRPADSDGDRVVDSRDACPNTPRGTRVNGNGCERDSDGDGVVNSIDVCPDTSGGVSVDRRGCERDGDGDEVVDSRDACPDTPTGVSVDRRGCEWDSDNDGIVNSVDTCPDTPRDVGVNRLGCERDSDGDSVVDSADACPDTPMGVRVDRRGCERDSDDDGVENSVDACPDTPIDVAVDRRGCERDNDGDGVVNSVDACPDTPRGVGVDRRGCEQDNDDDGIGNSKDRCPQTGVGSAVDTRGCRLEDVIVLKGVAFATNSAELIRHSESVLDEMVATLKRHLDLKMEVAGHTDKRGERAYNLALSKQRAESVRNYLIQKGISPDRLTAKGYGPDKPIDNNDTAAGQAANRRVELHILK